MWYSFHQFGKTGRKKKKKLLWEKELAEDLSFLGISANLSGHFLLKLSRHAKL